jgi:Icc-related predicted phosphoesterase
MDSAGRLRSSLEALPDHADLLLLAGDLTKVGAASEAEVLVHEFEACALPVVAVLGNHDYHSDKQVVITKMLEDGGVRVLEGDAEVVHVRGASVGVVGSKGFGGGYAGACGSDFGEPEMKAFVRHTQDIAHCLEDRLRDLHTDARIVLLHYAPVKDTLFGERLEIYPFLGSYLLAEAIDTAGADLAVHGHAHAGTEHGMTSGGVRVRNVAQPVIGQAFHVYNLSGHEEHGQG